jgi:hypothetical protein
VNAVYFCATKLEAFHHRGKGDFFSSHDLEDLLAVVDGREQLVDELEAAEREVRTYIAGQCRSLLTSTDFVDALPGHLLPDPACQARITILLQRLNKIAAL